MNGISKLGNSINFTAKMCVNDVKENKERWENIARIFEQKTQKYDDTFDLMSEPNPFTNYDNIYLLASTTPESLRGDEHCADMDGMIVQNMLENKSDNQIANIFVKMLKVFRHNDAKLIEGQKFLDKFMKDDKFDDHTNFSNKFCEILVDKEDEDLKKVIASDPDLKDLGAY